MISSSALDSYAFYEENHRELMFETFAPELGGRRDIKLLIDKVLKLKASEFTTRLVPAIPTNYFNRFIWTATIEGQLQIILNVKRTSH